MEGFLMVTGVDYSGIEALSRLGLGAAFSLIICPSVCWYLKVERESASADVRRRFRAEVCSSANASDPGTCKSRSHEERLVLARLMLGRNHKTPHVQIGRAHV